MSCECYQIGGRFIAEDPECEVHGERFVREREIEQSEQDENLEVLRILAEERAERMEWMRKEIQSWRERFPDFEYRRQDDCVALKFVTRR